MLVLTRKIGQQVILPEQGITIDVMEVGKTRVRLGISVGDPLTSSGVASELLLIEP